jgi:hypothetical protein
MREEEASGDEFGRKRGKKQAHPCTAFMRPVRLARVSVELTSAPPSPYPSPKVIRPASL